MRAVPEVQPAASLRVGDVCVIGMTRGNYGPGTYSLDRIAKRDAKVVTGVLSSTPLETDPRIERTTLHKAYLINPPGGIRARDLWQHYQDQGYPIMLSWEEAIEFIMPFTLDPVAATRKAMELRERWKADGKVR